MMKRGAHLSFVHFWGGGARRASRLSTWREIWCGNWCLATVRKLYLVPFEPIQREIVASAPEEFRILLYRRMMLRMPNESHAPAARSDSLTGDSLGQVASQTLRNMAAVGGAIRMPLYRPLAAMTSLKSWLPRKKSAPTPSPPNRSTTAAPFSCPATPRCILLEELERAESTMDVEALIRQGIDTVATSVTLLAGRVEKVESFKSATA